jgi:hypothetical protein
MSHCTIVIADSQLLIQSLLVSIAEKKGKNQSEAQDSAEAGAQ